LSKSILIVGGTGFLGYHLAKKCIKKKWKVTIISSNKPRIIRFIPQARYLTLDITKKKLIEKKIKSNYDFVINFGGYVDHNNKLKTYLSHYVGCKNLVDFFIKKKLKCFIQIGSCVEYGNKESPQKENLLTNIKKLTSVYGKAKLEATNYLQYKYKKNNFPCIILRLYLIYGPRQDFNRLIPNVIKGCLKNSYFPCSHGLQYRDFLYVDDLTDLILKLLKKNIPFGNIFNVGSGKKVKVKNMILLIQKLIKKGRPCFGKIKLRKDEISKLYPSIKKITKTIDWKPKISILEGIKKTISFYKSNL
jgi:nucleoside-diphosphate-sugar epimerase